MESLDKIQKIIKVFCILAKIAMIFAYVASGFLLIAAILFANNTSFQLILDTSAALLSNADRNQTVAVLLCDFVSCLTEALLLTFGQLYMKHELEDGTPFTTKGANEIRGLGIRLIVLPLVAIGIISAICATFNATFPETLSNELSLGFGITLIITSIIFRYGAELESKVKGNNNMKQGEQIES